ncbi:zinc finger protein 62 homolog isoform X2 [Anabrus simplex]|uniref:zinc finger protein 62 homolog isoform X2 n=1 Tax=Anabrus simplex TaxID=316456 RepID=UPI0035A37894
MENQTGFIMLSSLASKTAPSVLEDIVDKSDNIAIDNVQKTATLYPLLSQNVVVNLPEEKYKITQYISNNEIIQPPSVEKCLKINSNQVTHIEIIKSVPGGFRRITGANRVVPLLTSVWQNGQVEPIDNSLSSIYRTFLADLQNLDDRQCDICDQLLLSSTDVEYHAREVHGIKDIAAEQCFVCRKKYVFKSQLKCHLSVFHGIQYPELICKICFMEFNTAIEHKAHERKHDSTYLCQICSAKFRSEYFLQEHIATHIALMKPNECKKCGRRFGNSISLVLHMKRHKEVLCNLCNTAFSDELLLLFHVKNYKRGEKQKFLRGVEIMDKEESQLEDVLNAYIKISSCSSEKENQQISVPQTVHECMEDVLSAVSLLQNKRASQESEASTGLCCKLCGIEVDCDRDLFDHRRKAHLRSRTCPFCGKRNRSVSQTWRHMTTHIGKKSKINQNGIFKDGENQEQNTNSLHNCSTSKERKRVMENSPSYDCSICSRKFHYSGSRDKHILMHSRDETNGWKCIVCGEQFFQPKLLLKHMTQHEPEVKCHLCNEIFSKQSFLKAHLKSHISEEGRKRFKCNLCSVYCSTPSGLRVHHRIHTGERPYSCALCSKKFKRLQAVKKHVLVVHRGSALEYRKCCDCPMKFSNAGNLLRHFLRIHRHVRRYVCGVCGSRYGQNQDLRRHFKVKHQMEMPVIRGTDRKALNEIYVIPSIDNLPNSHPHAQKINQIVAEEKQKFLGVEEILKKKEKLQNTAVIISSQECEKNCNSEIPNATNTADIAVSSSSLLLHSSPIMSPCKDGGKATLENSSCPKSCTLHLPGDHRTSCCISYTDNKNSNLTLNSCNLCHTVFLGEDDRQAHLSESKNYNCKICNKNFCDQVRLQDHSDAHCLSQFHCNVCMIDFGDKETYEKHITEMNSVLPETSGLVHENLSHRSLHVLINEISPHEQETISAIHSSVKVPSETYAVKDNRAVVNSAVTNLVTLDTGMCNTGTKELMDSNNDDSAGMNGILPTTIGITGMICTNADYLVPNVLIQPVSTIIQSVPITYSSQNELATMPVITLQPATSPTCISGEHHSSPLMPVNELRNVALLNTLESVHPSTNVVSENENHAQRTVVSQIDMNSIIPSEPSEVLMSSNMGENQREEQNQEVCQEVLQHPEDNLLKDNDLLHASGKYLCTSCGEEFPNSDSLSRHVKSHSEVKPYCCFHCGKTFTEKCNLKVHLRIHTGERPYSCEQCGMQLRYQKDVSDHKRMHLGVKSYICDECGREFVRRRGLARHKLTHTGEKRHKCPICSKAFARLDQLKLAHMPTHDISQQQFSCEICTKTFRVKSKLKQHMILHSDQKDYHCPTCCKRFARETYLKSHLKTHKKQDGYVQCPKCPRRFASKETLQIKQFTSPFRILVQCYNQYTSAPRSSRSSRYSIPSRNSRYSRPSRKMVTI